MTRKHWSIFGLYSYCLSCVSPLWTLLLNIFGFWFEPTAEPSGLCALHETHRMHTCQTTRAMWFNMLWTTEAPPTCWGGPLFCSEASGPGGLLGWFCCCWLMPTSSIWPPVFKKGLQTKTHLPTLVKGSLVQGKYSTVVNLIYLLTLFLFSAISQ